MAATAAYLSGRRRGPGPQPVAAAHALYLRRFSRSVWLLDNHLTERPLTQVPGPVTGAEAFADLPERYTYIAGGDPEWPGLGVWIHLEHDANTRRPELRLLLDAGGGISGTQPIPVYLDRPTLTQALADYRATAAATGTAAPRGMNVHGGRLDESAAALADKDRYIGIARYLTRPEALPAVTGDRQPGARPARLRAPAKRKSVRRAGPQAAT